MDLPVKGYYHLLVTYLQPQRRMVALLSVLLLGGIALQLANPQVIRYFIDAAQANSAQLEGSINLPGPGQAPQPAAPRLFLAAMVFLSVAMLARGLSLATIYLAENVAWTATNALRSDLALHLLRLDMPFHKKHSPGELIERVDGDVTNLANFFSQFAARILGNALLVAGILALLFLEDARLGLGLGAYTGLTFLALVAIQRLAVRRWAAERQADADLYGFLEERFSGMEDIRAVGAEAYTMRRLLELMQRSLQKNRLARMASNLGFGLTNFLYVIGYGLGLGVGAYLYLQGTVTIGTAFLIVYYIGMLSGPLQGIREQAEDLQQATASIRRVEELFKDRRQVGSDLQGASQTRSRLTSGALKVSFEQVSFAYQQGGTASEETAPGNSPVLQEVSFQLEPGKVLGLLGRTGSGKSTLSRLLFRLYDPTLGTIRLGGLDLRQVSIVEIRQRVGMVTQEVQLFEASIRDNLTFFNPSIADERIEEALRELGLWEWMQAQGYGLDTTLFGGGQGLSAGEAQLLALTRVFLKDPGLLILDEASSRLDPLTEANLERALDRLLQDRTGIIIAHRLQTLRRADQILILEQGRVVEFGPRLKLAADPHSHFYRLLRTGIEEALA